MKRFVAGLVAVLEICVGAFAQKSANNAPMFAPYVDVGRPNPNLRALMAASGANLLVLGFIQSDGCVPAWEGLGPVSGENKFQQQIRELRGAGADVVIAFGGYNGKELALACPDIATLQSAYAAVIDKYGAKILDFDLEKDAQQDRASMERRNRAILGLTRKYPGLRIHFTLPATTEGLTDEGIEVLKSAARCGTPVAVVNLMTMDYGLAAGHDMAANAIAAANGAQRQLQSLKLAARLGITPMIGKNDTAGQTFTIADARKVVAYAAKNRSVARLSFWSLGRDNGSCPGMVQPNCSGVRQARGEFSRIFAGFPGLRKLYSSKEQVKQR